MNTTVSESRKIAWWEYLQVGCLGLVAAFAATPLVHLWLERVKMPLTWQAVLAGPYVLIVLLILMWLAVKQPHRRYKALVAALAIGAGVWAGLVVLEPLQGDVFLVLSTSVGILVLTTVCTLYAVLRG